jgi:hypothetical protein
LNKYTVVVLVLLALAIAAGVYGVITDPVAVIAGFGGAYCATNLISNVLEFFARSRKERTPQIPAVLAGIVRLARAVRLFASHGADMLGSVTGLVLALICVFGHGHSAWPTLAGIAAFALLTPAVVGVPELLQFVKEALAPLDEEEPETPASEGGDPLNLDPHEEGGEP